MTALADRLKVLKEAMTQGKWSLGCTFDAASFVNAGKECVAESYHLSESDLARIEILDRGW